jgi:NAD(P)-dependent dehydrogenase (short-subunit alcohol dehydrogenase family)
LRRAFFADSALAYRCVFDENLTLKNPKILQNKGLSKMKIKLKPIGEQSVVIFGASSGIGRLAALDFARRGAKVCVAARSESGLQALVDEITRDGGTAFYMVADAADFAQVKNVADQAAERFGRIDTWVHSAAAFLFAKFEQTEPEEFERMITVNLLGQIYGAKAALPYLKEQGGALIHISSVEAWRTVPYQSAYGASKHGIYGFIQAMRSELEHDGVPVSVTQILPAAINTPIYDKGRNKMPFKPRPLPPIYEPQVVSDAILYAAENPIKDLIAGGFGVGVVLSERFSPRLTDWVVSKIGFIGQKTNEPNPHDVYEGSLFTAVEGKDTVNGRFSGESIRFDPYVWLATNPAAKTVVIGALAAAVGYLALRKRKNHK